MLQKDSLKEWEENQINRLTLKFIFAATGGTIAATAISFILQKAGLGEIKPELLFIPWGVALVFGVSMSFRRGVLAERERNQQEEANKK
jgi:hypothetical protein